MTTVKSVDLFMQLFGDSLGFKESDEGQKNNSIIQAEHIHPCCVHLLMTEKVRGGVILKQLSINDAEDKHGCDLQHLACGLVFTCKSSL